MGSDEVDALGWTLHTLFTITQRSLGTGAGRLLVWAAHMARGKRMALPYTFSARVFVYGTSGDKGCLGKRVLLTQGGTKGSRGRTHVQF